MPRLAFLFITLNFLIGSTNTSEAATPKRPNVLLIITDDQGFGDIAVNGNPIVKTPNMDRLAREGLQHSQFCVSPVCAPTRASLMTGRYNYRTRAIDTYLGRAMMDPDEITLAEILRDAGYRTGIFGKWHLGDNYPLRANDQGFQESLVHRGGGLAQPSGAPNETYFDPELVRNGNAVPSKGYCTDIFADAAAEFIRNHRSEPWFTYLAFNAPHDPLEVPDDTLQPYLARLEEIKNISGPIQADQAERVARIYAMVARVDQAIGRVLDAVDQTGVANDTLIIFMTDNGPAGLRYNAGLRGAKGSVYQGGIRAPLFVRWPAVLKAGRIDDAAAHIDLFPTILDACEVKAATDVKQDGVSLLPRWTGKVSALPDRTLFFQWHRGDVPDRYRAFAAKDSRYKLLQAEGVKEGPWDTSKGQFQLFDLVTDPGEKHDISADHPEIVGRLKKAYDAWFDDVSATRGYAPPRIIVGTVHESPTRLTRQDWRGSGAGWETVSVGEWLIDVASEGVYQVRVEFPKQSSPTEMTLRNGNKETKLTIDPKNSRHGVADIKLSTGPTSLSAIGTSKSDHWGAMYLYVERKQPR